MNRHYAPPGLVIPAEEKAEGVKPANQGSGRMNAAAAVIEEDAGAVFPGFYLRLGVEIEEARDKFFSFNPEVEGKLLDLIFVKANPPVVTAGAAALTGEIKRRIKPEAKMKLFASSENSHGTYV